MEEEAKGLAKGEERGREGGGGGARRGAPIPSAGRRCGFRPRVAELVDAAGGTRCFVGSFLQQDTGAMLVRIFYTFI